MPRAVGKVFKKRKRVFIGTPKCRVVRLEEVEDSINNSTCEGLGSDPLFSLGIATRLTAVAQPPCGNSLIIAHVFAHAWHNQVLFVFNPLQSLEHSFSHGNGVTHAQKAARTSRWVHQLRTVSLTKSRSHAHDSPGRETRGVKRRKRESSLLLGNKTEERNESASPACHLSSIIVT
ncbi:hypothetical protein J6590_032297 [Homalodisca vitripennis]|nr:hypothetical protein J6590_032297 [Homalodisca vitripennis]